MSELEAQKTNPELGANAAPSRWEWLPVAACAALAVVYFLDPADETTGRFALFVALGLLPGTVWRLLGKSSWGVHRACFALSLVAFVLENPKLRPDRLTLEKMAENWRLVALGFLISFSQSLWGTLRIHRLLNDSGVDISLFEALKLCLSGAFFNIFLPGSTGGDAYRVYAVTHVYRARFGPALASISVDRLLGLPSLILVVVAGMLLDYQFFLSNRVLKGFIPFIAGAGAVCLIMVGYLAFAGKSHRQSLRSNIREDHAKPRGWFGRTHAMIASNVKRPATLPLALLYGFVSHLACILSCLCFGLALGVQGVPSFRYFLIVPLAMTINAIPLTPGGVGQGELAMATLLDMASPGMGNDQVGVMIMLLFRLSNMAVGLIGGGCYILGKLGSGERGHVSEDFRRDLAESAAVMERGGEGEDEWR